MFEYVKKKEWQPVRLELEKIIEKVHTYMRKNHKITFQHKLIGSGNRHLITRVVNGNGGFDFDYNFIISQPEPGYKWNADVIKRKFMEALKEALKGTSYSNPKDSTSAITIKVVDKANSRIVHSCDIAIIYYCDDADFYGYYYLKNWKDERKDCKKEVQYTFEPRALRGNVDDKLETILTYQNGWNGIRDEYLKLKNVNGDSGKRSFSLYLEAVNNIYNQLPDDDSGYDYYDEDDDDDYWD